MVQSRKMSMVEAATNVVVGYVLAILTQLTVFPLFDLEAALSEHLAIGAAFVAVSLVRGYVLRRLFVSIGRPEKALHGGALESNIQTLNQRPDTQIVAPSSLSAIRDVGSAQIDAWEAPALPSRSMRRERAGP